MTFQGPNRLIRRTDQERDDGHRNRLNGTPFADEIFAVAEFEKVEIENEFYRTKANVGHEPVEQKPFDVRRKVSNSPDVC